MTTCEQVIAVARRGRAAESEIQFVLDAARAATQRRLLRVCLDCFRAVLEDARPEAAAPVVAFLGELLDDPARRRMRYRILLTAAWIGRASMVLFPRIMALRKRPGTLCVWKAARGAAVHCAWSALAEGDEQERLAAIAAFERLGSLGRFNLENFLATQACDGQTRFQVQAAIERLSTMTPSP